MRRTLAIAAAAAAVGLGGSFDLAAQSQPGPAKKDALAGHGRYLVKIGGCNDCHTRGLLPMPAGDVPESEWLKGDRVGWKGPWGTTYAPNLRISLAALTEDQWVQFAHNAKAAPADAVVQPAPR